MGTQNIIVIGASAGGFEAIQTLVAGLPKNLPASIFIVWHMSADVIGIMPHVLNKLNTLPAANAIDGEAIVEGRIYVAPPDRHLMVENGLVRITRGPKENRFRPAVDPLFRSAANVYGPRVIGIILSGALDDGTSGLWAVKECGGLAVVQHPDDAAVSSMPESALREVKVDYTVPVADMPALLERLCTSATPPSPEKKQPTMVNNDLLQAEVRLALLSPGGLSMISQYGELSQYACPECHGVLTALKDGGRVRFRCHTGHAYSTDSLLASLTTNIDDSIWNAIRGIEESIMLLNHIGDHIAETNQAHNAAKYFQKSSAALQRLQVLKDMLQGTEVLTIAQIAKEEEVKG